jgi:carbon-monoxide dehydrogenase medium subunit
MKAPPFQYHCPRTLTEALALLDQYGPDAQVLAGGQSLMPMMNMRLSNPVALIDINRIADLQRISLEGDTIDVGAITRYCELQNSDLVREHLPIIEAAIPHIAHVAIRNRGTIGGSLVLSDPSAEMPACCIVANATMVLASRNGIRCVAAEEFATGLYTTARQPDEILTRIRIPKQGRGRTAFVREFSRRRGDFAIVGLAGSIAVEDGVINDARIVLFGYEDRPVLLRATAARILGHPWDGQTSEAAAEALDAEATPMDSVHASAGYRRKLARVLLTRALSDAVAAGGG